MPLGHIQLAPFLASVEGTVYGELEADAKDRYYKAVYKWRTAPREPEYLLISRADGSGDEFKMRKRIALDRSLIAFFGFYSGDGSKGAEDKSDLGRVKPSISVSQIQPYLVKFTTTHFRRLFPGSIRCVYSLGEDSAYFFAGEGKRRLEAHYGGAIPTTRDLDDVCASPSRWDKQYVEQDRSFQEEAERDLAFYHQHKSAMKDILIRQKERELREAGVVIYPGDRVTASLRRPYKKGAREAGGTSRSDELHLGGVRGAGELFLKILGEIEDSIYRDARHSAAGLVEWKGKPSGLGGNIEVKEFFECNPYGHIASERPSFRRAGTGQLQGKWKYSRWLTLSTELRLDPLWCYTAGLYLAEGTTSKDEFFAMYSDGLTRPALSFTSSEGRSLALILQTLRKLFVREDCISTWKLKVGSQYFPELVVIGLKEGVPLLRGGKTGQGKLRTMEVSLALKEWALEVAPALARYGDRYSHVEPTGAGVPRIDFSASSTLCRWYFPLLMYSVFGDLYDDPAKAF